MASKIFLALFAPACVFVTIMWAAGPEIDANWWALLLLTHLGATFHYVAGLWWCSYYLRYFSWRRWRRLLTIPRILLV